MRLTLNKDRVRCRCTFSAKKDAEEDSDKRKAKCLNSRRNGCNKDFNRWP